MSIFQRLNAEGRTVVMVTHEYDVAMHCRRTIRFKDGRVIADEAVPEPKNALDEIARLPRFADEEEEL